MSLVDWLFVGAVLGFAAMWGAIVWNGHRHSRKHGPNSREHLTKKSNPL